MGGMVNEGGVSPVGYCINGNSGIGGCTCQNLRKGYTK